MSLYRDKDKADDEDQADNEHETNDVHEAKADDEDGNKFVHPMNCDDYIVLYIFDSQTICLSDQHTIDLSILFYQDSMS